MARWPWWLTMVGAVLGGLTLLTTFAAADSAPQEAAGAALAVGLAVVPYVLARAFEKLDSDEGRRTKGD